MTMVLCIGHGEDLAIEIFAASFEDGALAFQPVLEAQEGLGLQRHGSASGNRIQDFEKIGRSWASNSSKIGWRISHSSSMRSLGYLIGA